MSADGSLVREALAMMRRDPSTIEDARRGAPLNNSVVGSLLSIRYKAPRWATEAAVREALRQLDDETEGSGDE